MALRSIVVHVCLHRRHFARVDELIAKSCFAVYKEWMNNPYGRHTPWGDDRDRLLGFTEGHRREASLQ